MNLKTKIIISFTCVPLLLLSATSNSKSIPAFKWILENIILVFAILVIIGAFFSLWNLANSIMNQKLEELYGKKIKPIKATESLWQRLNKKAWNLKPINKESEIVLDHDYDGIRELDNSLPPWWLYTFYITIIMSIAYIYVYHMSDLGRNQQSEYAYEMKLAEEARSVYLSRQKDEVDEKNVSFISDPVALEEGKQVFVQNCAACHGVEGQGGIGPNMTDKFWIHGGGIKNVFKTIKYGVPQKGMIPWKGQLKPTTMQKISSYILTLEGTNPPNPKEAEGELYVSNEENKNSLKIPDGE